MPNLTDTEADSKDRPWVLCSQTPLAASVIKADYMAVTSYTYLCCHYCVGPEQSIHSS